MEQVVLQNTEKEKSKGQLKYTSTKMYNICVVRYSTHIVENFNNYFTRVCNSKCLLRVNSKYFCKSAHKNVSSYSMMLKCLNYFFLYIFSFVLMYVCVCVCTEYLFVSPRTRVIRISKTYHPNNYNTRKTVVKTSVPRIDCRLCHNTCL